MKLGKWTTFALCILLGILIVSVWQISKKPAFTKAEIEARITEIYGGAVQNIIIDGDEAIVSFKRGQAMYEVEMDRRDGSFEHLVTIFEPPPEKKPVDTNTSQTTLLTPDEANTIATSKYFGTVQSNDFVENGEAPYYLIHIASTTQRYIVHIDAKRGNITVVSIEEL